MSTIDTVQDVTEAPALVFTDAAARKVGDLIRGEGNPNLMLRVFVQGGGCSGLQYGFEFEVDPPVTYDKVVLPRPVDLRRIAEWTETSIDEIQALNPELRRWTTPVRDNDYELKVPEGSGSVVQARLDEFGDVGLA